MQHCSSGSNELLSQNIFRLSVATARGDLHTTQVQMKNTLRSPYLFRLIKILRKRVFYIFVKNCPSSRIQDLKCINFETWHGYWLCYLPFNNIILMEILVFKLQRILFIKLDIICLIHICKYALHRLGLERRESK